MRQQRQGGRAVQTGKMHDQLKSQLTDFPLTKSTTTEWLTQPSIHDDYDSSGALVFTVVVLLLFGSSIIAFIAYSIKSSESNRGHMDRDVEKFLSSRHKFSRQTTQEEVREQTFKMEFQSPKPMEIYSFS